MIRKKIIVKGPVLSRSGYGEQSRFALEAIRSREDLFDVYVINIPWGHTGVTADNTPQKQWIMERMMATAQYVPDPLLLFFFLSLKYPHFIGPVSFAGIP